MRKTEIRTQKRVDGGQRSVGKGLSFLFLLFTVYCSLVAVFTGCASSKRVELPKTHATAIELSQRGVEAFDAGNYDMALIAFQKSLQLNTSVDNQNGICINLLNLGRLYLAIGRFDDAKPVLERAVKIGFNLNDPLIISEAYATLGRYYYLTGNNKDAMDNLEKAVLIDSKEGYRTIGSKLNIMGMVYKDSNRLEEAEKAFHDALKANQNYGLEAATADSFRGLGDVFLEKGDYKKAGESYKNALSIDKKAANSAKISLGLFSVGMSSLKENDAQIALDFFLRAYEVDSSRGDNKRALKTLDEIIGIYHELGDKNSMEKYLLERERLLQKETSLRKEGVGQK